MLEDLGERDRRVGAGGDEGAVDRCQREPRHPVDDAAAGVVVARDGDLSPESLEGELADVPHDVADLTVAGSRWLHGEGDDQVKEVGMVFERVDGFEDDQS